MTTSNATPLPCKEQTRCGSGGAFGSRRNHSHTEKADAPKVAEGLSSGSVSTWPIDAGSEKARELRGDKERQACSAERAKGAMEVLERSVERADCSD